MTIKPLSDPTDYDLEQVARCQTDAIFPTNPFAATTANDDEGYYRRRAKHTAAYETLIVAYPHEAASDTQETLQGVIALSLPGQKVGEGPRGPAPPFPPEGFSEERMNWLRNTMGPRWVAFTKKFFGETGMRDKLYIEFLAVAPAYHSKGFGGQLVNAALAEAKAAASDVILVTHSERLVRFYEKHGFKVLGHEDWQLPGKEDCRLWALSRDASTL